MTGAAVGVMPSIEPGKFGMPWGVESLTPEERYRKAMDAGVDQFGGVSDSDLIVKLVREGKTPEARVDESAQRILEQKFALGLFENPYVDVGQAASVVGAPEFRQAALEAQERSMVLLANRGGMLPLREAGRRVYLIGVSAGAAKQAGFVPVMNAAQADFALVRMHAPYEKGHMNYFFGSRQHEGDLDFKAGDEQMSALDKIPAKVRLVVAIYLDRPAILTGVLARASAVLANFGASDEALMAVVSGRAQPNGKLPFELPRSMDAVRMQRSDVAHDSTSPLFPLFFGLRYASAAAIRGAE